MKKNILWIILGLLSLTIACNKTDERILALRQRADALHKADAETKEMLIGEMSRLAEDVDDMLYEMEDRVLAHLEEMVQRVEGEILEQTALINKSIKKQSDILGKDIVTWRQNLDAFLAQNNTRFQSSHTYLNGKLNTAININNYDLVSRIRKNLNSLDNLEIKFNSYIKNIQTRVDKLKNMEKVYNDTQKAMTNLRRRKQDMLASLDDYETMLKGIVKDELQKKSNKNLSKAVDAMSDLYDTAFNLFNESDSYLNNIDDFYSNMPDIDQLLSEAEAIIDRCSDLESEMGEIDDSRVEEVLSYLEEALAAAEEGEVSFSDVEGSYEDVLSGMQEFLEHTNELMSLMAETLTMMEDKATEVEDYISRLN